jgi:hypothetical protein
MRLAFLSIGPLGNKPHLQNIDYDIFSAPSAILVPLGLSSSILLPPRVSHNLYYYTAPTAVVLDAALLSSPPDQKGLSFRWKRHHANSHKSCPSSNLDSLLASCAPGTLESIHEPFRSQPSRTSPSRKPCTRFDIPRLAIQRPPTSQRTPQN